MLRIVVCLGVIWLGAASGWAETIAGPVRVVDADTVRVGAIKVRLFGIDAPEIGQPCELADGRGWDCGRWASEQAFLRYQGAMAVCQRLNTDRYGRAVATCRVDGIDMGFALVRNGMAEAYRRYALDYVDAEKAALFDGVGLWRGRIAAPSEFRAARLASSLVSGCTIKGNISDNGRIYHLPGQAYYDRTRIIKSRGERWFCSESEAQASGWRPAQR